MILFKQSYGLGPNGERKTHYYNEISASIAAGLFIAAVQVTFMYLFTNCLTTLFYLREDAITNISLFFQKLFGVTKLLFWTSDLSVHVKTAGLLIVSMVFKQFSHLLFQRAMGPKPVHVLLISALTILSYWRLDTKLNF